jgi:hypothetical protein
MALFVKTHRWGVIGGGGVFGGDLGVIWGVIWGTPGGDARVIPGGCLKSN